jgi:hypothetical protein
VRFRRSGVIVLALSVALSALCARARPAAADGLPPDGPWTMTPVTETFTVQQWSAACGPAPVSGTALPGGPVTIRGNMGEIEIDGMRRPLRTDQCVDNMPTLSRDAHSSDGKSWRTRCSTPTSDPRRAVVNTAYFLGGDDTITVAETGRYEFLINGATCIADVKREGSLRRTPAATATRAATATPTPTPTATPRVDCSSPGNPARLEVRPSRKLLRLGDTFGFHAVVLDAIGCATGTPIQWSIGAVRFKDGQTRAGQPTIDAAGKLSVPGDLPDVTFDVIAAAAGRAARASVDATSSVSYEALLAQSGLDPNGERDEPAVAMLATESIGAAGVRADDGARRRRMVFILVVGTLVLALGVVAVLAGRRAGKARAVEQAAESRHAEKMRDYEQQKRDREEKHAAQMRAHLESVALAQQAAAAATARGVDSGPMFCPSCRREFSAGSTFCPFDANRLVAVTGHENLMAGPAGGICPTCRRGYNPGVKVCPHDGDELVPPAMAGAQAPTPRGKICPTCGGRFEGSAGFCGKDGTQLVLLN